MKNNNQPKQNYSVSFCAWILIIIMFASVLSSCTAVFQPSYPTENAAELTPLVAATMPTIEVPNGTLSLEATATNTPDPLATAEQEDRNLEEIIKNINEFLASQGKFSLKEIVKNSQYFVEESYLRDGELPLGMVTSRTAQFMLLGSYYDQSNKQMHFYLGATDVDKERVVFNFNFRRDYEIKDENEKLVNTVPIYQITTSLSRYMSVGLDKNMKLIFEEKEWKDTIEEAMLKPISLYWRLDSMEKFYANQGHPGYSQAIDYDLAADYRIAIFNRLGKYGEASLTTSIPPIIDSKSEADNLICFWTEESFMGVESLNTQCPSANQIVSIAIRRP